MATRNLIIKLAKFLIAAAWADGELKASEVNVLKDLIYSWGEIGEDDWTDLEAYMDSPVYDEERGRILAGLLDAIGSSSEKRLVLDSVTALVAADGQVSDQESRVLEEVRKALDEKSVGIGALLGKLLGGAVQRRTVGASPSDREDRIDDFIRNKIYFRLVSELERDGLSSGLPDQELRKLCLTAGLLAQVAWIDEDISSDEKAAIVKVLCQGWAIEAEVATIVCRISVDRATQGIDYFRLTRSFFESTSHDERLRFLRDLFRVANSCGKTSFDEIEQIRRIARSLKLSHEEFTQAKLSVSSEDRRGL